jgi:GWxTD domain-containing protein
MHSCFSALAFLMVGTALFPSQTSHPHHPALLASPMVGIHQRTPAKTPEVYTKWLEEDVRWIITDPERADFLKLTTNESRDEFVERFWSRRNPDANSSRNSFKEEHYRRIAYSNVHFPSPTLPGWRTDRGHIYIVFGQPDSINGHPVVGHYVRLGRRLEEGRVETDTEIWQYRHVESLGHNVEIEFADTCRCGDYQMLPNRLNHLIPKSK